jgi:hypothetical protein
MLSPRRWCQRFAQRSLFGRHHREQKIEFWEKENSAVGIYSLLWIDPSILSVLPHPPASPVMSSKQIPGLFRSPLAEKSISGF